MDITKIPFNKHIDISNPGNGDDHMLELRFKENMKNHIGTFHASAQFALAEACSGLALQLHFPHFANSVVPLLRKSDTKFKRPATSKIKAKADITLEVKEIFEQQLEKKGRATIAVPVEITDEGGNITMVGIYEWFVQKI